MNARSSEHDSRDSGETQLRETLKGTLVRVVWSAPDSGFVVAQFRVEGELFSIPAVGEIVSPVVGDRYVLEGSWDEHPKYGRQFRFTAYEVDYPTTPEGIARYLASGLIQGIGRSTAGKIVARFGGDTLEVMNTHIERLAEVEGIGPKTLEKIRVSWEKQRGVQNVMLFLKSHDISTTWAVRVYRTYGADSIRIMQEDPYRLVDDIEGIGFVVADGIARSLGVAAQDPLRVRAGIGYALREAARRDGHCCVPREEFLHHAAAVLEVDEEAVLDGLREAIEQVRVIEDDDMLFLPELYHAERAVAEAIALAFGEHWNDLDHLRLNKQLTAAEERTGLQFNAQQVEAVHKCLAGPICILTGGPGTGKTTTLIGILAIAKDMGWKTAICAPTGRAAKRISEVTGFEARTIHRLLEFDPVSGTFQHNDDRPIEADLLVVDEMSMVDLPLMAALLRARAAGCRIVLVGDADQLPPVGPGAVLRDLIASETIDTVVLTLVLRQSAQSSIVTNAHRVRQGFMPVFDTRLSDGGETFFRAVDDGESIAGLIRDLVVSRLPAQLDCDPVRGIQVLSPMHATPAGVSHLNRILQQAVNGGSRVAFQRGDRMFRSRDKVMQTRNDYERDVYNGDIGYVHGYDEAEGQLLVDFDGRRVRYAPDDLDTLVLAYAITIHKSQGSEYPIVIVPLVMQHRIMLRRTLLYTAMTRAKDMMIILGARSAIATAVNSPYEYSRHGRLRERLHERLS